MMAFDYSALPFILGSSSNTPVPDSPSLLLFSAIMLLTFDVTLRLSHRRPLETTTPNSSSSPLSCQTERVKDLTTRANQISIDFQALERQYAVQKTRRTNFIIPKRRRLASASRRLSVCSPSQPDCDIRFQSGAQHLAIQGVKPNNAFAAFCERLLLMNHMWRQEKQIKALRIALCSEKASKKDGAFKSFCDRLLLSNSIWKMEKEITRLMLEAEKIKRSRVAAVTRAAKQMVLDVRKERLIDEFVKDLIQEVSEGKETVSSLRAAHEREILEITEEWRADCRKLVREVEHLRLAEQARMVQQEISNDLETSLFENLTSIKRRAECLENIWNRVPDREDRIEDEGSDGEVTLSGGDDMDVLSDMSSSTCVSSEHLRGIKTSPRTQRANMLRTSTRVPAATSSRSPNATSLRKLDTGPYVGFSFNPLFYGHPELTSGDVAKDGSPAHEFARSAILRIPVRPRTVSSPAAAAVPHRMAPALRQSQVIPPWRV